MLQSHNNGRGGGRPVSPLIVCDLRAQLAPLNRYGLPRLGVAFANGLRALFHAELSLRSLIGRDAPAGQFHET